MENKKTYLKIKFGGGNKELIDDGYNWTIDCIKIFENACHCIETVCSREKTVNPNVQDLVVSNGQDKLFFDVGITTSSISHTNQSQSNHPILYFNCTPIRTLEKSEKMEIFSVCHNTDLGFIDKQVTLSVDMSPNSIPRFIFVKSIQNIDSSVREFGAAIDFISVCFCQNILKSIELVIEKETLIEDSRFKIYINILTNNGTTTFDIMKSKYSADSIGKNNLKNMRKVTSAIIDTQLTFEQRNPNLIIPPLSIDATIFKIGLNSIIGDISAIHEDQYMYDKDYISEAVIDVATNGQKKNLTGEYIEFYSKSQRRKIDAIYSFRNQNRKNRNQKITINNFSLFNVHNISDIWFLYNFINNSKVDELIRISFIYMTSTTKQKLTEEYGQEFHVSFMDAGFDKNISIVYMRSHNGINNIPADIFCLNDFYGIYEEIFSSDNYCNLSSISPDDDFDAYMRSVFINSHGLGKLYEATNIVSGKFPRMKKDGVDYFASPGVLVKRVTKNTNKEIQ